MSRALGKSLAASLLVQLRSILVRWERLRLHYNALLCFVTLASVVSEQPPARLVLSPRFFLLSVACAVGANLCFLAGPVVEMYLCFLGVRSRRIAPALFLAGSILSIPIVHAVVRHLLLRDF